MNIVKTLFKDSFVYGVSSYVNLLAAFILTPIYTRILSKESYGLMDLCNTWNSFFMLVIPLGLTAAMLRTYQDFKDDHNERKKNLGSLLSVLVFSNLLYCFFLFFLKDYIYIFYYKTNLDYRIYWLSMGIANFSVLTSYFQTINRVSFKKYTFLVINLTSFFILSTLGFILVYFYKYGILGFFIAGFIANLAAFIFSVLITKDSIYFYFEKKIIIKALKYSLPLLIVLIFMRLTHIIDRVLINNFLDLRTLGDYSIVIRVSSFFQILISAFSTAWFPHAMNLLNDKNRNKLYNITFNLYLSVFTILGSLIIFFSKEILLFLAPDYLNIINQIILIIIAVIIGGTSHFFGLGLHILKKSKFFMISAIVSFLVNVISSIILLRFFGLNGIILGSILSTLTWVFVDYYNSYKKSKISFNYYRLFYSILIILLCGLITFKIDNLLVFSIEIKFSILLLVIVVSLIKRKKITTKIGSSFGM